jgi:hypothetical protein
MELPTIELKQARPTLEQTKARLIRQGEFYRVGVVHAKAQLQHAARPETLFHSALDHAASAVRSRADSLLTPTGASVASITPYALAIYRFVRHRKLGKASIGVALVLAGVGWYLQRRRTAHTTD